MLRQTRHIPVLVPETIRPRPGQIIVDCTIGLGGHTASIYSRISPDPVIASEAEQKANPRSRSAKPGCAVHAKET